MHVSVSLAVLLGWFAPADADGIVWQEAERLTFDTSGSLVPDIAVDPAGTIHVVWWDLRDGNNEIYLKQKHPGQAWGSDERLTNDAADSRAPAITVDLESNAHLVWQDDREGDAAIYYKKWIRPTGSWTAAERVSLGSVGSIEPAVCCDAEGKTFVVWEDRRDGNWEIYLRTFDGLAWGDEERMTDDPADSHLPVVVADPTGHIHLLWADLRSGMPQIWGRRFDGSDWTAAQQVSSLPDLAGFPAATVAPDGTVHAVWWGALGMEAGIFHRAWDGAAWSLEARLASVDPHSSAPDVAASPSGAIHVVWDADPDGNQDIFHQMWDGQSWSDVTQLTFDPDESWQPTVATDPGGDVHVVWYDDRDGGYEIYHQLGVDLPAAVDPPSIASGPRWVAPVPNPTTGPVSFLLSRPVGEPAVLRIFEATGRPVRTLLVDRSTAALHSVSWDGTDDQGRRLVSGVYFYRLVADERVVSGQITLAH